MALLIFDWKEHVAELLVRVETFFNADEIDTARGFYLRAENIAKRNDASFTLPSFPEAVSSARSDEYCILYARHKAAIELAQQTYRSETELVKYRVIDDGVNVYAEYLGIQEAPDTGQLTDPSVS